MALGFEPHSPAHMPVTVPKMRNHKGLIEQFRQSKQLLAQVTGVENPFSAVRGLKDACGKDSPHYMSIHVLTRNGTIYLLSLDYAFKQIPSDIREYVKFVKAERRKSLKSKKGSKK